MKLKYLLLLTHLFFFDQTFSQKEIKVSCKLFVDNTETSNKISRLLMISNHSTSMMFSLKNTNYFLIDSNFLNSETNDIQFVFKNFILSFKDVGDIFRNYDIRFYFFSKDRVQKKNEFGIKSKYCYYLGWEPRLTDEKINNALKNGTPYNSFRTKDYYVF